ncbi:hypothetical protein UFOVP673_19 [uncultured Caudovirales phage]|uniref:Uncharacterized protein n=1 Tax=uncultured Caudovirales phage TaxID=2100421 RepID=A0A6J5NK26_9CAUD|nr:hypothetical protein UFOVP673_19 [uncultured Caudovirales phage]
MAATATEIANLAIAHLGGRALTALSTDTTQQAASMRKWYNPDAGTPIYTALDEVLRAHPWNFATARKRQTIAYQTLTGSAVTNQGGLVKITFTSHGYVTGDRVYVKDVVGVTVANGQWYVTRIDANNFTLDDSVFAGTYTNATGKVVGIPAFDWDFQHTPPTDCLRVISLNAGGGQMEDAGADFTFEKGLILTDEETINLKYIQRITDVTEYPADFVTAFSFLLASYIAQDTQGASGQAQQMRQFFEKAVAPPVKARDSNEGKARRIPPFNDSQIVSARFGSIWTGGITE